MDPAIGAAIIAAITSVILTVLGLRERKAHNQAHKESERLELLVQRLLSLPPGTPRDFEEEAAFIRDVRICRHHYLAKYRFRRDESERLHLDIEISYTVVNYTQDTAKYAAGARIVVQRQEEDIEIVQFRATGNDLHGQEYDSASSTCEQPSEYWIPSNAANPDNRFELRCVSRLGTYGSDVLYFPYPTLGVEIQIQDKPLDIDVSVDFGHRLHHDVERFPAADPNTWRLNKAFLPWQSVYIVWQQRGLQGILEPPGPRAQIPQNARK